MQALILVIHVLVAISLIALVLLQHGKGADVGAAFGSGASNTMFGSTGSLPFLIKLTAILAAIFFATSLALSYLAMPHKQAMPVGISSSSVPTTIPAPPVTGAPAAPQQNH
jgi:preprotein translocase subunit SecG